MFMERLRRSQGNVLLGLFNTGVKMLGLGAEEIQKDKTTEILKLLVSESKATSRGNGQYNKVSDINRLIYLLCVSPFLSTTFYLSRSISHSLSFIASDTLFILPSLVPSLHFSLSLSLTLSLFPPHSLYQPI